MAVTVPNQLPFSIVTKQTTSRFTAFIYGFAGSGKTHLARTVIDTPIAPILVCSCDEGHLTLRSVIGPQVVVTRTTDIKDFEKVGNYLLEKGQPFKTLMIDNLTELHRKSLLSRAQANSAGKTRDAFSLTQQDYGEARNQLLTLVSRFALELKSVNVIFTALASRAVSADESSIIEPSLGGKLAYELPSYCDLVGYLSIEQPNPAQVRKLRAEDKEPPEARRVLQCAASYKVPSARNRGGYLPATVYNPNLYEIFKVMTSK